MGTMLHQPAATLAEEITKSETYYGQWKFDFSKNELNHCPRFNKILQLEKPGNSNLNTLLSLIPAEHLGTLLNAFKLARCQGTDLHLQVPVSLKSGQKWIRISGTLYHRKWGHPLQMIGVIEDVSQKIQEDKLSLAILNHELRTPLTVIRLHAQMLCGALAGSKSRTDERLLHNITRQTDRMIDLLDEFTNITVDQDRKRKLNVSEFDLGELIERTLDDMRMIYRGLRFQYAPASAFPVKADKLQLMQVMINYLTNAAKFSPKNLPVKVEIYRAGGQVEVAVRDQGMGFPCGHETQLFNKFYSLQHLPNRQQNSKGLGLYLVKDIVQQHGGSVRAECNKTYGTSFYFSVPLMPQ